MRRPGQLRLAALLGSLTSLMVALLVAFILNWLLGHEGRLGFRNFNAAGLLEGLAFVVSYSFGLLYTRNGLRLPSPSLLSFGLLAPPTAARAAATVPVVEMSAGPHMLLENRIVIVEENGVPVGVSGVRRERISSWDELPKIQGSVAVTELRAMLAHEQLVIVMDGSAVRGIITQDMYLLGLWGEAR